MSTPSTSPSPVPRPAATGPGPGRPGSSRPGAGPLAALVTGMVAGLALWLVGLPDRPVWDTTWRDLTVPAALAVALGAGAVALGLASRRPWRVVDMTVAAVLAVAGGLFLWGMNVTWTPMTAPIARVWPPLPAVLNGVWVLPAVLAGLVVRKPGAAVFAETVAGVVEALAGGTWGFASVYYGVVEGLGVELVLALLLYRRFGLGAALLAGAGGGLATTALDLTFYLPDAPAGQKLAYLVLTVLSATVVAGAGSWALARALARSGALAPLAAGRGGERV